MAPPRSRSTIAPHSLQAADLPTVAAPVTWDEMERAGRLRFLPADVLRRLDAGGDPLEPALGLRQPLP